MSVSKRYVLDANVFIQAHRVHYAFDICPGFWAALLWQSGQGVLCSIDRVKAELLAGSDQLEQWVKETVPRAFFKGTADQRVVETVGEMVNWAQGKAQFRPEAKAEFAGSADAWLVAFAKVNEGVVVTHEVYDSDTKKRVKIPNVCMKFGVECCDPFDMLRRVGEQFVRRTRRGRR